VTALQAQLVNRFALSRSAERMYTLHPCLECKKEIPTLKRLGSLQALRRS